MSRNLIYIRLALGFLKLHASKSSNILLSVSFVVFRADIVTIRLFSFDYVALEQKNLANEALRQTAREKVAKAQGQENKGSTSNNTNYRDRASERRIMHGQPDVPFPDVSTTSTLSKKAVAPVIVSSTPAAPPKEPAKDENNIGNKLLKKMGWSEGTGLGLSGEGRIDPVYVFDLSAHLQSPSHLRSSRRIYLWNWDVSLSSFFTDHFLSFTVKQHCMLPVLGLGLAKERILLRLRI